MKAKLLIILSLTLFICTATFSADPALAPKYGPSATRLYDSREFIRKNNAPDFWALMPYYMHQFNDKACSVASVAMVVNAARVSHKLTASDELATQEFLLKKVSPKIWNDAVGKKGKGVALAQLGSLIKESLEKHGLKNVSAEVFHVHDKSPKTRAKIRQALIQNEKSDNDFIIANYLQSTFTGDPEGAVGHISPVAAYDAKNQRVLIFDPDRQWYEPYWVSEETFIDGMNTQDSTSQNFRGYVWIKFQR